MSKKRDEILFPILERGYYFKKLKDEVARKELRQQVNNDNFEYLYRAPVKISKEQFEKDMQEFETILN